VIVARLVRYVGGPLDGETYDADEMGWDEDMVRGGTYQIVDGWALRAHYEPEPDSDPYRWVYRGPVLA
jgi:hypothetical protein